MTIESVSAITLATREMEGAVVFYEALGFELLYGGRDASFTSFRAGTGYLNLLLQPGEQSWSRWGRAIFYVDDVGALFERVTAAGLKADTSPRDADWGERYFHITDPDGHALSFARPLV